MSSKPPQQPLTFDPADLTPAGGAVTSVPLTFDAGDLTLAPTTRKSPFGTQDFTPQRLLDDARRFGLQVTSGQRSPSANRAAGGSPTSLHLSANAYDFGGDPARMREFATFVRDTYGSNVAELFHRDVSVKNGQPGKVRRDHDDHVHVAWASPHRKVEPEQPAAPLLPVIAARGQRQAFAPPAPAAPARPPSAASAVDWHEASRQALKDRQEAGPRQGRVVEPQAGLTDIVGQQGVVPRFTRLLAPVPAPPPALTTALEQQSFTGNLGRPVEQRSLPGKPKYRKTATTRVIEALHPALGVLAPLLPEGTTERLVGGVTDTTLQAVQGMANLASPPVGLANPMMPNLGPLARATGAARKEVKAALPREQATTLYEHAIDTIGQFAPYVVAGVGGAPAVTALGVVQQSQALADEAEAAGANPAQVEMARMGGAVIGLTSALGPEGAFQWLAARGVGGKAAQSIIQQGLRATGHVAADTAINIGQQVAQNVVAKDVARYDPQGAYGAGVKQAALVGGLVSTVGHGSRAFAEGLAKRGGKPTAADVEQAISSDPRVQQAVASGAVDQLRTTNPTTRKQATFDPGTSKTTDEVLAIDPKDLIRETPEKTAAAVDETVRHETGKFGHAWNEQNAGSIEYQVEAHGWLDQNFADGQITQQQRIRAGRQVNKGRGLPQTEKTRSGVSLDEQFVEDMTHTGQRERLERQAGKVTDPLTTTQADLQGGKPVVPPQPSAVPVSIADGGTHVYRIRDAGERGLTPKPGSHAEATTSLADARAMAESRGELNPELRQEIVAIDTSTLPQGSWARIQRGGKDWVKFETAVDEGAITPLESIPSSRERLEALITGGERDAEAVRSDTRQPDAAGQVGTRGQADSGGNVRQPGGQREGPVSAGEGLAPGQRATQTTEPVGSEPLRERRTPITLEEHGLAGGRDRYYAVKHHEQAIEDARAIIDEKGLEGTQEYLRHAPPSAEATVAAMLLDDHYTTRGYELEASDPQGSAAMFAKADEVASELAARMTATGQATSAVNALGAFTERRVLMAAQKRLDIKGRGEQLTVEQRREFGQQAARIRELEAQVAQTAGELQAMRIGVERGKPAVKPSRSALGKRLATYEAEGLARDIEFVKTYFDSRRGSGGPGTDYFAAAARVGAYWLGRKTLTLTEWSEQMVRTFGEGVRPHLNEVALGARNLLRQQREEARLESASIKPLTAVDEIDAQVRAANKEAKREATKEKAQFASEQRATTREAKAGERQATADTATTARAKAFEDNLQRKQAVKADEQGARETEAARKEAARDAARWDFQLRTRAMEAEGRLRAGTSMDPETDIAAVGADRIRQIGEEVTPGHVYTLDNWHAEMARDFGEQFTGNVPSTIRDSYDLWQEARADWKAAQATKALDKEGLWAAGDEAVRAHQERLDDLKQQAADAKRDLATLYDRLDPGKRWMREVVGAVNAFKSIKSAWDLSAAGRQGMWGVINHPFKSALAFRDQLRALPKSPEAYVAFEDQVLRSKPRFRQSQKAGVDYTLTGTERAHLSQGEEAFMSDLLPNIERRYDQMKSKAAKVALAPVKAFAAGTRASEQAYVTFLNVQRAGMYDMLAGQLERPGLLSRAMGIEPVTFETAPHEYQAVAQFINNVTGRGDLGKFNQAAPILNSVMFSPRWIASRLTLLNPAYYWKLPKAARVIAMREAIQFAGTIGGVMWAGNVAGIWDASLNPDDPDFLKLRIGNVHLDPTGGFQNILRFLFRMAKRAEQRAGHDTVIDREDLRGAGGVGADQPAGEILTNYARGKASPLAGTLINFLAGTKLERDDTGYPKPFRAKDVPADLLLPLTFSDFKQGWDADKKKGVAKAVPSFFGLSTQVYNTDEAMAEKRRRADQFREGLRQRPEEPMRRSR